MSAEVRTAAMSAAFIINWSRTGKATLRGKSSGVSIYKVVSLRRGRIIALIHVRGKKLYLGMHKSEVEAAKAYNAAAKTHFGEFAYLNEIPECTTA